MILLLVSLFLGNIPSFAFSTSSKLKINCLIINLDYVDCTWSEPELKNNYSFKSRWLTHDEIQDCPEYHRINGVNVGCVFPYKKQQRFKTLNTWLYSDNGSLVTNQEHELKDYVKLNPPFNLTLVERKDAELWLYWNVTNNNNCIESEVRHRTDKDWKNTFPSTRRSFSLPFPSKKRYEFQVRSRISLSCGESKFWSDWSQSVYWGSFKPNNGTEINCLIINLDYVDCTWSEPELKNNYSFKSRWLTHDEIQDCPEYHRINGVNVGCVFPYKKQQRFQMLNTWLYSDNGSLVTNQEHNLKDYVKLNPPFNLTLVEKKDAELWLYWNVTNNNNCIESEVRHRTDKDWKNTFPSTRSSFSLPFPSKKRYEFQVRSRISLSCGESKFWSDWSQSVYWGSFKPNNAQRVWLSRATIILIIIAQMLVHSERQL